MKKYISAIIFWGAAWGIAEATVGYALHMIPFSIGWFFWFPIAFFIMNKVYKDTGKLSSILYTCSIASAIKLTNLLLPTRIDYVINPAVSILLEGIMVVIAFKVAEKYEQRVTMRFFWVLAVSISWKVLYVLYLLVLPSWIVAVSPIRALEPFLKFFFIESTINALVIYGCLRLLNKTIIKAKVNCDYTFKPVVSFGLLSFALIVQLVL